MASRRSRTLKTLSPDKFQRLIADRLEGMGFGVQLVGNVYAKDGGVDIIASPDPRVMPFPFLLAVQAKHHHTDNKCLPRDGPAWR